MFRCMTIYQLVKVGRYERSLSGVISLISDTAGVVSTTAWQLDM